MVMGRQISVLIPYLYSWISLSLHYGFREANSSGALSAGILNWIFFNIYSRNLISSFPLEDFIRLLVQKWQLIPLAHLSCSGESLFGNQFVYKTGFHRPFLQDLINPKTINIPFSLNQSLLSTIIL